jgi:ABC-2 type transport system ATP-binding protein
MSSGPSIYIQHLTKQYAGTTSPSLSDLTVHVMPGEVYGFLGPNGAGKSTAIRTLMNFLQPTSGSAQILGYDIVRDSVAIKQHVGYLSGDFDVYPKMTGRQYIAYLEELQGSQSQKYARDIEKRMQAVMNKKLGELSRGQRQKVGIIQAFMHKPEVLILDEPSSGLDPLMQEVFYELVHEAKQRGAAIFISSHIMAEVQKICDRVGIIREGKLITERSVADLAAEAAQTFDITFSDKPPIAALKKLQGVNLVSQKDNHVALHLHGELQPLLQLLGNHRVTSIDSRNLDLEEMFMHYYHNGGNK